MSAKDKHFIQLAIQLASDGVVNGNGGPFGAIVVKDGQVIGQGSNCVTSSFDPTAHAEIVAIRDACKYLNDFQLTGCVVYASCEPCPMCLGAIYWARPDKVIFAANRHDAAIAGFDDEFIYSEINRTNEEKSIKFECLEVAEKLQPFEKWKQLSDKKMY